MSMADVLSIIGIVAAVIGIGVAAFYGNRALNPPKRLMQWHSVATPLIAGRQEQHHGTIEVRILDQRMDNPYVGTLTVENIGRHDIESSSFDQGRPIRFEVHHAKGTVTFLDQETNPPGLHVNGNSILIGPELLRSKSKWTKSFVTDGQARIELAESYMVNAIINKKADENHREVQWARIFLALSFLFFLIIIALFIIIIR